ncbi:hypothetical protein [Mycobacterium celatum]|uniref:Uncharacterized protein n=1 Tax=Mycobacterium celatum TaxID=28045 RepID=A0A1X1RQ26_MYCCE|nr:hypothetical protein [Mycobacterium celatum]ORV11257.1 hypothetical protein AWB95_12950 [Mycobacterium celatum]PIB79191.1 hypothetical protein CQY23_09450 [Mycobacterium celatum]
MAGSMPNDDDRDSTAALAALYAAERTDVQNILGHALTLVSVLVAYATVIGAVWATRPDTVPHYLIPVIPLPALLVIAWHSQLNSRVWAHNQVIFILEQRLLDQIPSIKNPTRLWIGHTSGRLVNEIPILLKERRFGMAAASIITYGGVLTIVLALTVSSLMLPIVVYQDWQWLAWTMAAVYAIALVLLAASYKSTFGVNIETMDEWAKSAHATFPDQFKTTHGYREGS